MQKEVPEAYQKISRLRAPILRDSPGPGRVLEVIPEGSQGNLEPSESNLKALAHAKIGARSTSKNQPAPGTYFSRFSGAHEGLALDPRHDGTGLQIRECL